MLKRKVFVPLLQRIHFDDIFNNGIGIPNVLILSKIMVTCLECIKYKKIHTESVDVEKLIFRVICSDDLNNLNKLQTMKS